MSNACDSQLSSGFSAALIPPCAALECERTGWTLERMPTDTPSSAAARAARMPARPAPITRTSCWGIRSSGGVRTSGAAARSSCRQRGGGQSTAATPGDGTPVCLRHGLSAGLSARCTCSSVTTPRSTPSPSTAMTAPSRWRPSGEPSSASSGSSVPTLRRPALVGRHHRLDRRPAAALLVAPPPPRRWSRARAGGPARVDDREPRPAVAEEELLEARSSVASAGMATGSASITSWPRGALDPRGHLRLEDRTARRLPQHEPDEDQPDAR